VQSQSVTVDRQMKRYKVPRIAFINKLDRMGANPRRVIKDVREKLKLNAAAVQLPVGLEGSFSGLVDLVRMQLYEYHGEAGVDVRTLPVPAALQAEAERLRQDIVERLADVDEEMGELFLSEERPTAEQLKSAIRRAMLAHKFVPVFMGSAFKNKGVQTLLDGVHDYLPAPTEMQYEFLDVNDGEKPKPLACDPSLPLVALAFKLEDGRFGQLTYIRIYQGTLRKGMFLRNSKSGKKVKVPRVVRMHSNEMEDVEEVGPGEICALFGVECSSGDTFTDGDVPAREFNPSLMTMFVPEPVVSLAIAPKDRGVLVQFGKALSKFTKEDPTFRVHTDPESNETIISGMGELHLEIYTERMRREYNCDTIVGRPQVNYRETVLTRGDYDYLHKKQSGGAGQYARVVGYIEPLAPGESAPPGKPFLFENAIIGNVIPPEFITAVEKGFAEAFAEGPLLAHPVQDVKVVLTDGAAHAVDSSELAFKIAARYAFKQAFERAMPTVLEPVMSVEIEVPEDYQGNVVGGLNKRRGAIQSAESRDGTALIRCDVPLAEMFGYSTEIRSATQARGEFTMEMKNYQALPVHEQKKLVEEFQRAQAAKQAKKK
jgi:elongation factor G